MSDDLKVKIAVLEQRMDDLTEKLKGLDEAKKDFHRLIRKIFFVVLISFFGTIAYLAKGILDKAGS